VVTGSWQAPGRLQVCQPTCPALHGASRLYVKSVHVHARHRRWHYTCCMLLSSTNSTNVCDLLLLSPGGPVSLASACGSQLVLACGSSLTCLAVDCCSGSLALTATAELQQQASALAVFKLQGGLSCSALARVFAAARASVF
jgi:hypothetical protein